MQTQNCPTCPIQPALHEKSYQLRVPLSMGQPTRPCQRLRLSTTCPYAQQDTSFSALPSRYPSSLTPQRKNPPFTRCQHPPPMLYCPQTAAPPTVAGHAAEAPAQTRSVSPTPSPAPPQPQSTQSQAEPTMQHIHPYRPISGLQSLLSTHRLLLTANRLLLSVFCPLPAYRLPSTVYHLPSTIYRLPSTNNCLPKPE